MPPASSSASGPSAALRSSLPAAALKERLSIAEMVRILDVAGEVRRKQNELERQFRRDESRDALRERLRSAGPGEETLSEDQLDAAIDWYYDNLHRYRRPKASLSIGLAHLYIRRGRVIALLLAIVAAAALVWWLLGRSSSETAASGDAPTAADVDQAVAALAALNIVCDPRIDAVVASSGNLSARRPSELRRLLAQAKAMTQQLELSYVVAIDRDNPFVDVETTAGPVEAVRLVARTDDGMPIELTVPDANGSVREVSSWPQQLDRLQMDAIRRDLRDGKLDDAVIAEKVRGSLDLRPAVTAASASLVPFVVSEVAVDAVAGGSDGGTASTSTNERGGM